jgi:cell shape-determining protein MreC
MRLPNQSSSVRHGLLWLGVGLVVVVGEYVSVWPQIHQQLIPGITTLQQPFTQAMQQAFKTTLLLQQMWGASQKLYALEAQYSQAVTQLQELEQTRIENRALRKLLENSDRTLQKTVVTAPVVSFAQPTILVGSEQGVRDGSVVVGEGTVLGILSEVYPKSSKVELLTQLQHKPILAQTQSGAQGLIRGQKGSIWLTEVASDVTISVGERVTTVGQVGIPQGLLIGVVGSVSALPQEATQHIQVRQLVSFYTTAIVEVY